MGNFRRFAFFTTLATYFLIFVGGLVRVAGAGMGCPDWPKCFGSWIPPVSLAQLPPDIDAAGVNLTLTWIEYGNRLAGMTTGILILITAFLAFRHFRKVRTVLWPTIAAAVLVAFEGWQGSVVVSSNLQPLVVSVHLLLAMVIASLLIYATQESYYHQQSDDQTQPNAVPPRIRFWVALVWLVLVVQVIVGTQVRQALETVAGEYPLWGKAQWLAEIGIVDDIHLILGLLSTLLTLIVCSALLRSPAGSSPLVKQSAWGLILLTTVQVIMGIAMLMTAVPALLDLFHLWLAALSIGLVLVLYTAVRQVRLPQPVQTRQFSIVLVAATVVVVLMGMLANGVVTRAAESRENIPVLYQLPDFQFTERSGEPFGSEGMQGKVNIVDFIFTRCRSVCPSMCTRMQQLYQEYAHSDMVQFVSIDVDPDYDSLSVMREFLAGYGVTDDRWKFIRGEMDQVVSLADAGFKVGSEFPALHSTRFILVDEKGQIRGYYEHSDDAAIELLKQHVQVLVRKIS